MQNSEKNRLMSCTIQKLFVPLHSLKEQDK